MSTDQRARAMYDKLICKSKFCGCFKCRESIVADTSLIATALADERRRALEEAAGIAEMFSINKQRIHPDIAWDNMSESARTVCHMTCQNIALALRAKAHAGQEG